MEKKLREEGWGVEKMGTEPCGYLAMLGLMRHLHLLTVRGSGSST
jgi:hypothetical protein